MSQTADFLVELGTEELPPKALKKLSKAFTSGVVAGLDKAGLKHGEVTSYAGPRRLAIMVAALEVRQADRVIEKQGPNVAAAFDAEGNPSKACQGFARSCGVEVADLIKVETPKGEKLAFRVEQPGEAAEALLPAIVDQSLAALPIPKRMRWGNSRTEFVRPVRWLLMLLGEQVVDAEILELKSGNQTFGHRFRAPAALTITKPSEYAEVLRSQGSVISCFAERRAMIVDEANRVAAECGGTPMFDEDLLDEMSGLVEWPFGLAPSFEQEFLEVPPESLISAMQEHQKCLAILDKDGKLLNRFITMSNIDSKDPRKVIEGNERVMRARLADAAFFYKQDLKHPLDDLAAQLSSVVFQKQLGSVADKSHRVAQLAGSIAEKVGSNVEWAKRAGELCKADLLSEMVYEFTDLQGLMGRYYAEAHGEPADVAAAIYEQYLPKFAGDELPKTATGQAVALADRLDTLVGIFGINQPPTGSKDPYALRRAALGVLRIIVEGKLELDLVDLMTQAVAAYGDKLSNDQTAEQVVAFMLERFRAWYQDEGIDTNVINAVMALKPTRPQDFAARVQAVQAFIQLPQAEALSAANKRVGNLLSKSAGEVTIAEVNAELLSDAEEKTLAAVLAAKQDLVAPLIAAGDYSTALEKLADLREPVDAFFDNVRVMADDEAVKNNRLSLLGQLQGLFLQIADISLLQS